MAKLIAIVSRWLAHKILILFAILGILLAGSWLRLELIRLSEDSKAITTKKNILASLRITKGHLEKEMAPRVAEFNRLREIKIASATKDSERLKDEIRSKDQEGSKKLADFSALEKAAEAAKRSFKAAERRRDTLANEVGWWQRGGYFIFEENRKKVDEYEKSKVEAATKQAAYHTTVAALNTLSKIIESSPVKALQKQLLANDADFEAARTFKSPDEIKWEDERKRKENEISDLENLIKSEEVRVASNPRQRFIAIVLTHMSTALWILVGVILTPVAIKAAFYYGLAPLAVKFPPIRILDHRDAGCPSARTSAVSIPFDIPEGREILVHPDFLQSTSQPAIKHTQWLLNRSLPFSSIASGMFFLTRIRSADSQPTRVVVSSQNDAFSEISAINLPTGAAMVVQPRSLAGVVKDSNEELCITRHWRLTSLHAWLTLQLRFLVFHGPCELILKGCRGVRAETPDPARPRMINQASTIGFSANLEYHNTRCETFISYLRGKEDLFNDLFGGDQGMFVYEEMPSGGRKAGLTGRGLEGVVDATLKVFGI